MIGNGYELTKAFYDEVEANEAMQVSCKSHHHSLYTWICELRNRTSREVIDLPVIYTLRMSFIGSAHTLATAIDDLEKWGIIEVLSKVKGQGTKVRIAIAYLQKHCNNAIADMQLQCNSSAIALQTTKIDKTVKTNKTKKDDRFAVRENVWLSPKEVATLKEKLGDEMVESCFDKLSAYKLASNKRYNSDYGAINTWVIGAVEQDMIRSSHLKPLRNSDQADTHRPQPTHAPKGLSILNN